MKRVFHHLALTALFVLLSTAAFAQAPELRGTWKGPARIQMPGKTWDGECAFVINEQNGQLFTGYKLYFHKDELKREAFSGFFSDDGTLYFAEAGDGYAFGRFTAKQAMTVGYIEDGALHKSVLYKLKRVHFTTGFVEIDKNGDKLVMRAEVANHYPLNAERIIKEADRDDDGKLTNKEWESWKRANNWE